MLDSSNLVDDDDTAAKLMPNVAKLIQAESDSLESNGSTSMSLCGISGKEKTELQNAKPSRQRRAEAVFRDVANKFLRRGAAGKRSVRACKPSTFDTLSANYRRNAYVFEKENLRPKASTLVKQGALQIFHQRMALRDTSQKGVRGVRKNATRSVIELGQRRTVNPKIQEADKSITNTVPEHSGKDAATVILKKASHSNQGSERACYVFNVAAKNQRGKANLCRKPMPLNFSELQEQFAELDGEALEEEEVSIAHLTTKSPILASETVLQHTDDIQKNAVENRKDFSRREDEVRATLKPNLEGPPPPKCSNAQGQEGIGMCTSQSKLSKTPSRDQDVQVSKPACNGNFQGNVAGSSGTNFNAIPRSERQPSLSDCLNLDDPKVTLPKAFFSSQESKRSSQISSKVAAQRQLDVNLRPIMTPLELSELQNMCVDEMDIEMKEGWSIQRTLPKLTLLSGVVSQHADGDERNNVKCRIKENSPLFEQDSASHSVNGMEDKASSAGTKTSQIPLNASMQELGGKGTRICAAVFELEHDEGSCNYKKEHSQLKPNVDNFKELMAHTAHAGADANASHQEDTVHGRTSTSRENVQAAPSKAECLLKQEGVPDIPLLEGIYSTRDTSATPPRNPLLLTCLHHSRIGRSIDMSQRRLVFDSPSESISRQKVVDSNSDDISVSTVEFKGRTNPANDILNPDVYDFDANMTSIHRQEARLLVTDDEVICHVGERGCTNPTTAKHCKGLVEGKTASTVSIVQAGNLSALEASRGVLIKDPGIDSLGPRAGPTTEVSKARGLGKRTWANLGDPIDGGTEWRKGRRVSTRIKSRPLDWWRGERMLYGRVHSTLCTLIGIKTASPDPTWPRPKPHREDYNIRNFHIDSFVGDSHHDLLRLAAQ